MNRMLLFAVLVAALLTADARAGARSQPIADPRAAGAGQEAKAPAAQDDDARGKGGQPTGSKFTPAERRNMVQLHNKARAEVGVSPLKWSPDLAAYAQKWADHIAETNCKVEHRPASGEWQGLYGEGVYGGVGPGAGPTEAFNMWESSKRFYTGQPVSATDLRAANYTQLVWSTTTQFGCGRAVCKNGMVVVICNYDPKGNMVGQKPY